MVDHLSAVLASVQEVCASGWGANTLTVEVLADVLLWAPRSLSFVRIGD